MPSFIPLSLLALSTLWSQVTAIDANPPQKFGLVVFPAFQALDVYGPLDILNILSWTSHMNLSIISSDLSPVSTQPRSAMMNPANSTFSQTIIPTHTFATAPTDLEVLIVPGGVGAINPNITSAVTFVRDTYPKLKYIISICTGATILAKAGVLDGKHATMTKGSWKNNVKLSNTTTWHAEARWVSDGNVWTSSGVSAGIDATFAWVEHVWGEEKTKVLADGMEWERQTNQFYDAFAAMNNATDYINGVDQNNTDLVGGNITTVRIGAGAGNKITANTTTTPSGDAVQGSTSSLFAMSLPIVVAIVAFVM